MDVYELMENRWEKKEGYKMIKMTDATNRVNGRNPTPDVTDGNRYTVVTSGGAEVRIEVMDESSYADLYLIMTVNHQTFGSASIQELIDLLTAIRNKDQ